MATFALGQDNAFGQPLESQLRSCLLAMALCEEAGFDPELRDTVYWVALLRYLGCTGHAHEIATVFGDDIAVLAETLVFDAADPADVMRAMVKFATAGRAPEEHEQIVASLQEGAHDWAVNNFATGCEVADMLVQRLGLGARRPGGAAPSPTSGGTGTAIPTGARGDEIPLAMRVVHLTHDMEAIARRVSPSRSARGRARPPRPDVRPGARRPLRGPREDAGSTCSTRWNRGTPCSTANRNPTGPWRAPNSTRPSRWRPTSST